MLSHSQNYLNNKEIVTKLINFVDFKKANLIIEIGSGKGIITEQLLSKSPDKIIAIEADPKLYNLLREKFRTVDGDKLEIVSGSVLNYRFPKIPFLVVSNIPFNITADIIRKITQDGSALEAAYLIVQKEAAVKFIGPPHAHSPLFSHFLNITYKIKSIMDISKSNYSPRPRYDTTFISIEKREQKVFSNLYYTEQFKDFLVYLFERRRPFIKDTLRIVMSNLQSKIILKNLKIDERRDIKSVYFNEWVDIFNEFSNHVNQNSFRKISGSYKKLVYGQGMLKKVHRTRGD